MIEIDFQLIRSVAELAANAMQKCCGGGKKRGIFFMMIFLPRITPFS
jgi:hypothetical protein